MKPEELASTFSRNLVAARKKAGVSQRALANRLDASPNSVVEWEKGKASPTLATVAKIAKALDVPPEALLTEIGSEILASVPA